MRIAKDRKMRPWCVSIAVLAVSGSTSFEAAAGSYCTTGTEPDGNIYAILQSDASNAGNGARVYIDSNSIRFDDQSAYDSDFVAQGFWYGMDGSDFPWNNEDFIGVGMFAGTTAGREAPPAQVYDAPTPFVVYASEREKLIYDFYVPLEPTGLYAGGAYEAEVQWAGSPCLWNVYFGAIETGTQIAQIDVCGGSGRALMAGLVTDSYANDVHIGGNLFSWQEQPANDGAWISGWDNPTLYMDCPAQIEYVPGQTYITQEELHGPF